METTPYERISSTYHGLLKEREHLECRIREAASILNTMSPINRLPAEVLVHIYTYVKPSFQDDEFDYTTYAFYPEREVAAWLSFVGVCRSWRTVACTTPLLWRDIRIGKRTKLPLFRLFLLYSGHADVNITFSGTRPIRPFLEELVDHVSRIRKLSFQMLPTSRAQDLSDFLHHDMPRLGDLSITFGLLDWEFKLLETLDDDDAAQIALEDGLSFLRLAPQEGQFPRLTRLNLRNVELVTSMALNPSILTQLVLRNLRTAPISLSDLPEFLEKCHSLRKFALESYGNHRIPSVAHNPRRVQLSPTLRWFGLQDWGVDVAAFLSKVVVPATTKYVLLTKLPGDDGHLEFTPLSACIPQDRAGLPLLDKINKVDMDLRERNWDDRHTIRGFCGGHLFSIEFDLDDLRMDIAKEFLGVFGDCPITELNIAGVGSAWATAAQWTRILQRFSLLKSLAAENCYFWGSAHASATLLLALATVQADGTVTSPDLQVLSLAFAERDNDNAEVVQAVIACLEARAAMGHRLSKLRVRGMGRSLVSKLCPHADSVEVYYDTDRSNN